MNEEFKWNIFNLDVRISHHTKNSMRLILFTHYLLLGVKVVCLDYHIVDLELLLA